MPDATYTWIPQPILERLGISPSARRKLQLANGQVIDHVVGLLLITVDGKTVAATCIFGDPNSLPLLGAVTLEGCGLAPDPVRKRLIPVIGTPRLAASPATVTSTIRFPRGLPIANRTEAGRVPMSTFKSHVSDGLSMVGFVIPLTEHLRDELLTQRHKARRQRRQGRGVIEGGIIEPPAQWWIVPVGCLHLPEPLEPSRVDLIGFA